jgi:hypothetical protein
VIRGEDHKWTAVRSWAHAGIVTKMLALFERRARGRRPSRRGTVVESSTRTSGGYTSPLPATGLER